MTGEVVMMKGMNMTDIHIYDEENKITCEECDFVFWVIWQNDGIGWDGQNGGYCPRCGCILTAE